MVWGRKRNAIPEEQGRKTQIPAQSLPRSASAVAAIGAAVCVLFFSAAADRKPQEDAVPIAAPDAVIETFLTEHAALADAIGINEYFPSAAVEAGTFSTRGEEAYRTFVGERESMTFGEYMRDALRFLFGLS